MCPKMPIFGTFLEISPPVKIEYYLVLRKVLLLFILSVSVVSVKAQDSYNYAQYGVGIFASSIYPYDDLRQGNNTKAFNITGYCNLTPYIPLGAELQLGEVSG